MPPSPARRWPPSWPPRRANPGPRARDGRSERVVRRAAPGSLGTITVVPILALLAGPALVPLATPASAQAPDRIWGRVHTPSGDRYEGFIRWDRNEGSWTDILDGSKEIPEASYEAWLAAARGGERPTRTIDLMGYRVSWNEEDPDFPREVSSGVRFGHLAGLIVLDEDRVQLVLRSGQRQELAGGATDIGTSIRDIVVEDPDGEVAELDWDEVERIDFFAAPPGARPRARRLYGTVEDRNGRRFTGHVAWDLDEILESDVLDGEEEGGRDWEIPFRDIRAIERASRRASRVILASGEERVLRGSNDVGRGHRGVQISDPSLGMVEVEWEDFHRLDLSEAPAGAGGYDAFDGGHRLEGVVETASGQEFAGRIRWDADEEWSWELLDGRSDGVRFSIELGRIHCIEKPETEGVSVTLLDGRTFELDDSNDVTSENRGVFVEPGASRVWASEDAPAVLEDAAGGRADAPVHDGAEEGRAYVPWDAFRRVCFEHPAPEARTGQGVEEGS